MDGLQAAGSAPDVQTRPRINVTTHLYCGAVKPPWAVPVNGARGGTARRTVCRSTGGGSCGASGAVRRVAGTSGLNPTMTRGASGQLRGVDIGGAAVTDGEKL